MQHARRVDPGIVAEEENAVRLLKIVERDRADRNADAFRKADRRALVAHVRTVRQVIGPVHACEQRVHVGRFERGPARAVKDHALGIESLQFAADLGDGVGPIDGNVFVRCGVPAQGMCQPALFFKSVIRPV